MGGARRIAGVAKNEVEKVNRAWARCPAGAGLRLGAAVLGKKGAPRGN